MLEGGEAAPAEGPRKRRVRLSGREWQILLVLAAVQFTHIVDFMIVMPLSPQLEADLHITPVQFGIVVAAYALSAGVAGLVASFFLDRFDRKRSLFLLYTGFVIGTGGCALAPNFALLVLFRVIAGAFGGVGAAMTLIIVGDVFEDARRGTATGVLMSAFSVASIVGVPAGTALAVAAGHWQAPFAVLAGLAGVVLAVMLAVLPSLRGHLEHGPRQVWREFVQVISVPNHLNAFALMLALVMSTGCLFPYLPGYLVFNVGLTQRDLIWMYVSGGLVTLVTLTVFGWLADRFGKLSVFRVLGLLTVVPILLSTNLPAGLALGWVLAVTTVYMVIASGRMVPAMALITASATPQRRGSFLSVNSSVQQLALAVSAFAGGLLLGQNPAGGEGAAEATGPMTGYNVVGWLGAGMAVVSVYLGGRLRPAPGGLTTAAEATAPFVPPDMDLTPFAPPPPAAPSEDVRPDGAVQDAARAG
jgi:predicted MFS family arabinose efflux permease